MASANDGNNSGANKLNRELLRWIQSLDLAYSIKNVKRDFANGFLVAEIMSRYYDKDISMHSYDNGIGLKVKKDNWDQLVKLFNRLPDLEPLTSKAELDAVIHCQNGAAVAFITKLYQCLTKRTIQPTVMPAALASSGASGNTNNSATSVKGRDSNEEIPPYAKTTGATLIREKMRNPEIAETSDETEVNRKVSLIQAQHEEHLQLDRLMIDTPDRYPSLRSASKATVLRGATKPVRNDDNPVLVAQHVVKEVQIKSMNEKSLEKLRVTREAKENEAMAMGITSIGGNAIGASFDGHGRGVSGNNGGELVQKRRPIDLLNEAIARKLATMGLASRLEQKGGKDKFESFLEAVHEGRHFGEDDCANVLQEVVDDSQIIAIAFLDFPREFWKFAGLVTPLLVDFDEDHSYYQAIHQILLVIGQHCVRRDGTSASLLMTEYLLSKLINIFSSNTLKRASVLQLVYAFVPETPLAHIQAIKRLREALAHDIPLFIHALSILLYMESQLDETLVDLYHYYCCIGLETPCEKLRAASLSMLIPFVTYDFNLVADLLPRLTRMATYYAWWEVKAQLVITASALLHVLINQQDSDKDFTEQIELALRIIEREFHPGAGLNVRRVGLSYVAKNLRYYQELVPLYVDVLFTLTPEMRTMMISTPSPSNNRNALEDDYHNDNQVMKNELPLRGTSGAKYELKALVTEWDSAAIVKQLFYENKTRDSVDADVLHVIQACFMQLASAPDEETRSQVAQLYDQIKNYLVLGLLDEETCGIVARLMRQVVSLTNVIDIFHHDLLIETLQKLVTKNIEDLRQQTVVKLLHEVYVIDGDHAASVSKCMTAVRAICDQSTFKLSLFSIGMEIDI
ncbi:TPA: hypothetical protein N0F65_006741 [Lagenidium giganteum]|uniref:Spermatogenesis-associated protein 4 n=1 Tax=Lagenidium giganteum TaxID=4803 RepID=A0AAV2YZ31_9STRA|nr:TPA: hypothetical protein N0F65_006741 [Lagenidium giganteum]